jgi:hypothetical protein
MEELIEPETVRAPVQFLELEKEEMILQGLGALDAVFALARSERRQERSDRGLWRERRCCDVGGRRNPDWVR